MPSQTIEKKQPKITVSDHAHELVQKIKEAKENVGTQFLKLGAIFSEINRDRLYRYMDCDTFEEFIGMPEIGFKRATVFLFIRVYETFIERLKINPNAIAPLEISKLQIILPVIDAGGDPIEWLDKTMALSRHDLLNEVRLFQGKEELEPRPKPTPEEVANYEPVDAPWQERIKDYPCVVCGTREEIDAHHFPRTKGAGADNWKVIPLCRSCHTGYHNDPKEFLWTWRIKIFDFFYSQLR